MTRIPAFFRGYAPPVFFGMAEHRSTPADNPYAFFRDNPEKARILVAAINGLAGRVRLDRDRTLVPEILKRRVGINRPPQPMVKVIEDLQQETHLTRGPLQQSATLGFRLLRDIPRTLTQLSQTGYITVSYADYEEISQRLQQIVNHPLNRDHTEAPIYREENPVPFSPPGDAGLQEALRFFGDPRHGVLLNRLINTILVGAPDSPEQTDIEFTARVRQVLRLRFGLTEAPMSLARIGNRLGTNHTDVITMQQDAMRLLGEDLPLKARALNVPVDELTQVVTHAQRLLQGNVITRLTQGILRDENLT